MKLLILLMALFIFSLSVVLAEDEIKFHYGDNNVYIVELNSSENVGEKKALEIIAQAGKQKCGDKPAHFGKYRFEGKESLSGNDGSAEKSFRMIQQLFCGELSVISQQSTKPLSPKEKIQLERRARQLTTQYLDYLANSDFKKAYSLFSTVLKQGNAYEDWVKQKKHLSESPGNLVRSEIWGLTTYVDPPSSLRKGVYIAADFDREYSQAPIFCGYLVWYREKGNLKLIREDIGSVSLEQFTTITAEELPTLKSRLRCKPPTDQTKFAR